jgi:hypothetical protein
MGHIVICSQALRLHKESKLPCLYAVQGLTSIELHKDKEKEHFRCSYATQGGQALDLHKEK